MAITRHHKMGVMPLSIAQEVRREFLRTTHTNNGRKLSAVAIRIQNDVANLGENEAGIYRKLTSKRDIVNTKSHLKNAAKRLGVRIATFVYVDNSIMFWLRK